MSHLTTQQLHAFLSVASHGGFSFAADELHMSQPAVSQQIRGLEHLTGVALFERRPRGAVLTPAGEALLPHAVASVRAMDALMAEAERQRTGFVRLRIGAIPTTAPYLLPQVVRHGRSAHPDVQLQVSERRTADLLTALDANQIDLALIATEVDSPEITTLDIARDPFLLAVAEDDPLAGAGNADLGVLADREVLLIEDGHCLRGQAQSVCTLAGVSRTHDVAAASLGTVCQMVAAGQGVTLLPGIAVDVECRPGSGVRAVPLADGAHARTLRFAWRRTSYYAPRIEEFAHSLREALVA